MEEPGNPVIQEDAIAGPSSSGSSANDSASSASKYLDRMKRLREMHVKRNEARKLNHVEVVEEDRRNKLPSNYEAKKQRQQWELHEIEKRKEADEKGLDYERMKLLETQADIADKLEFAKNKKKNPHTEFKDYETMTLRAYSRNVKNIKHPEGHYEAMRNALGEDFYPTANTLIQGAHYPDKEALNRLADDTVKQKDRRMQFQRKRAPEKSTTPVDYINAKNKRFNETVDRFYGQYTEEIKQSLERGTAI